MEEGELIFKELDPTEIKSFKEWAWDFYKPGDVIDELWHPVIQAECQKINSIEAWCERYQEDVAAQEEAEYE